jgi:RNAse (barnase) inhibitor barstar
VKYPVHFTAGSVEGMELGEGELFDALASALALPDYFGRNWDALDECLRDREEAVTLVVRNASARWERDPEELRMLIDVWLSAAEGRDDLQLVFVW